MQNERACRGAHRTLIGTRSMQLDSTQFVCGHFGRANITDPSVLLPLNLHQTVYTELIIICSYIVC